MKGLHFKAEILLIRLKRVNITGNYDFFPPYRKKKAFPEFSTAKIHGTNVCDTANSEEKKKPLSGRKKKYKLDFRKGHFGQGT